MARTNKLITSSASGVQQMCAQHAAGFVFDQRFKTVNQSDAFWLWVLNLSPCSRAADSPSPTEAMGGIVNAMLGTTGSQVFGDCLRAIGPTTLALSGIMKFRISYFIGSALITSIG